MKLRISFISDTHTKHNQVLPHLPGGDVLIHAGDFTSVGRPHEVENFCKWFDRIGNYTHKVFIPGNHDLIFENHPDEAMQIVNSYKDIIFLLDDWVKVGPDPDNQVKIYGSPWQPEFMHWAFNLPRNGRDLENVWSRIPEDTDILVTHGPPFGKLDTVKGRGWVDHLGCEKLMERIQVVKPKVHAFGHIHSGNGYTKNESTHFVNASVLNERYAYEYKPLTIEWDPKTDDIIEMIR